MPTFPSKVRVRNVTVKRATGKALLVETEDGDEHWIPQSQIDDDSDVYADGDVGDLVISEWIAKQKGLA